MSFFRPNRLYKSKSGYYFKKNGKKIRLVRKDGMSQRKLIKVIINNNHYHRKIKRRRPKKGPNVYFQKKIAPTMVDHTYGHTLTSTGTSSIYPNLPTAKNSANANAGLNNADVAHVYQVYNNEMKLIRDLPKVTDTTMASLPAGPENWSKAWNPTVPKPPPPPQIENQARPLQINMAPEDENPPPMSPAKLKDISLEEAKENARYQQEYRAQKRKEKLEKRAIDESKRDDKKAESKEPEPDRNKLGTQMPKAINYKFLKKADAATLLKRIKQDHKDIWDKIRFEADGKTKRPRKSGEDLDNLLKLSDLFEDISDVNGKRTFGYGESGSGKFSNWKKGLYDDQVEQIINEKSKRMVPVIMNDEIPKIAHLVNHHTKDFGFVLNTEASTAGDGEHWMAVYISIPRAEIDFYDPLASHVPTKRFLRDIKILVDRMDPEVYLKLKVNSIKQQSDTSDNCGFFSAKFLCDMFRGKKFADATYFNRVKDESKDGEKMIKKWKSYI